jgi:hypothetical protein
MKSSFPYPPRHLPRYLLDAEFTHIRNQEKNAWLDGRIAAKGEIVDLEQEIKRKDRIIEDCKKEYERLREDTTNIINNNFKTPSDCFLALLGIMKFTDGDHLAFFSEEDKEYKQVVFEVLFHVPPRLENSQTNSSASTT